ncbi:MAG: fructose-bisphosphate aldolase [Acidimicrobiaceae bacterium]|nr:fructose-bisphosphate aldolase [Acidimicrobiaceae bacterium]MYL02638.1 fructose-bisphosphate aldolase [Acidimicrobiaceae bacterium]
MNSTSAPLSAVSAGKRRRFRHIFRADGRAVFVAMDHPSYMGMGVAPEAAASIARGGPDAILATWQLARARPAAFAGAGLVLRVDGGISDLGDPPAADTTSLLYTAEQAMVLGADAVVIMVFPGTPDEQHSLQRLARLAAECELLGLPVMAESIPGGWPRTVPWTAENVGRGARLAVELGADIVKTMCPGPVEEFAAVAEACPAPVVALGGPKVDDEDQVVALARGVVEAGGAGVAFGRNVWGSDDPAALVGRLLEAVHGASHTGEGEE